MDSTRPPGKQETTDTLTVIELTSSAEPCGELTLKELFDLNRCPFCCALMRLAQRLDETSRRALLAAARALAAR